MQLNNTYLVWLEWSEKCFRIDAGALRALKDAVKGRGRIVCARSETAFLKSLPQATHALVWQFRSEWFARAPHLKVLATPAAGREFVPERGPKGVRIHFGHFHGRYMAETVAAFMLAWCRGFFRLQEKGIADDPWPRSWLSDKCSVVKGTKAVIFGYGNVGRAIGAKLEVLGVNVTGVTRHGVFCGGKSKSAGAMSLSAFLKAADWVILALPSTTGTDDFLDAKLLRKLSRRCVVINVGRGNAIDERALYEALATGRLAGAYLDVRKHEPSATVLESPGFVSELRDLPNFVSTPHSAAFDNGYLTSFIQELDHDRCL